MKNEDKKDTVEAESNDFNAVTCLYPKQPELDMIVNENKKNEEREINVESSTANGRLVLVAPKERDEINPRQKVMLEANLFSKMGSGLYCLLVLLSLFQQDFVICIFL